jgi:hypothetical protein
LEELSKVATTTVKDNEKDSEPAPAPADGSNDSPTGEGALSGGKKKLTSTRSDSLCLTRLNTLHVLQPINHSKRLSLISRVLLSTT